MQPALYVAAVALLELMLVATQPAQADWSFNASPKPNAFIQSKNMTVELQCDRIRFAPAAYEDAQEIQEKQDLSIRFMKNGSTEVGAFQAGAANSSIQIVDNYPVEIVFSDRADYDFVLDQLSKQCSAEPVQSGSGYQLWYL